jgi:hypothetical protein
MEIITPILVIAIGLASFSLGRLTMERKKSVQKQRFFRVIHSLTTENSGILTSNDTTAIKHYIDRMLEITMAYGENKL